MMHGQKNIKLCYKQLVLLPAGPFVTDGSETGF